MREYHSLMKENHPYGEHAKRVSPFPVTRTIAKNTLAELVANPNSLQKYGLYLSQQNSELFNSLNSQKQNLQQLANRALPGIEDKMYEYQEGAILTYAILHNQAQERGGNLPEVTQATIDTHSHDRITTSLETKKTETIADENYRLRDSLIQDEPELATVIAARAMNRGLLLLRFFRGAADVYYTIKNQLEADQLKRQFDL